VTNVFNKEILYSYYEQQKTVRLEQYYSGLKTCKKLDKIVTTATYLESINYADGKYRVRFERGARNDYTASWDTDPIFHTYEQYRLKNIYVEQMNKNGVFVLVRRYMLDYKPDSASDIIFPRHVWSKGGKTNTLASITEYGQGGAALPPVRFTYDNLHLIEVDNGYGGKIQLKYNLWYYPDQASKSHTVEQRFGRSGFPCATDNLGNWFAVQGELTCGDGYRDPLHIWGPSGIAYANNFYNPNAAGYGSYQLVDLVRPGNYLPCE
jgi:hypothetical protein